MKHRTITGLVAVALLLAAAATAATTIKPPSTDRAIATTGMAPSKGVTPDVSKLQGDDDKFAGARKPVRYEAVIANWKRYRSAAKPNQ
jgi:hypothetical protein